MADEPSNDGGELLNVTFEEASDANSENNVSRDTDFDGYERRAFLLRRDDDDDSLQLKPRLSKHKMKTKKPRQQQVLLDLQYANKPLGASSSSSFVGDDDVIDQIDYLIAEDDKKPQAAASKSSASQMGRFASGSNTSFQSDPGRQFWDYGGASTTNVGYVPAFLGVVASMYPPPIYQSMGPTMTMPLIPPPVVQDFGQVYVPWSTDDGSAIGQVAANVTVPTSKSNQSEFMNVATAAAKSSTGDPTSSLRFENNSRDPLTKEEEEKLAKLVAEESKDEISFVNGCEQEMTEDNDDDDSQENDDQENEEKNVDELGLNDEIEGDENAEASLDVDYYEREIERLEEELSNARKSAESTKKALQLRIEQLTSERNELEDALKKLRAANQSEQQKLANEKRKHNEESEKRKQKINELQSQLDLKDASYNGLLVQLETLQKANAVLEEAANQAKNRSCGCNIDLNGFKQRASCAEVTLLRLKRQVEVRSLERASRDAEYIIAHLASIIEKASKEDVARLTDYQQKWKLNLKELQTNKAIIEKAFDEQIGQVESGVSLSTLSPIIIPQAPPPPPPPTKPSVNSELIKSPPSNGNQPGFTSTPKARSPAEVVDFGKKAINNPIRPPPPPPNINSAFGSAATSVPHELFRQPPPRFPMQAFPTGLLPPSNTNQQATSTIPKSIQPPPGFVLGSNMQLPPPPPLSSRPSGFGYGFGETSKKMENGLSSASNFAPQVNQSNVFRPITTPPMPSPTVPPPMQQQQQQAVSMGMTSVVGGGFTAQQTVKPISATGAQNVPAEGQQKTKVEQLIDTVLSALPHMTRENVLKTVEEFRGRTPSKSLRGIPWPNLVRGVCQCAEILYPPPPKPPTVVPTPLVQKQVSGASAKVTAVSGAGALSSSASAAVSSGRQTTARQEEDECSICFESMSVGKKLVMECQHSGHEACLLKWFTQHKSCPICRTLALPPSEYPSLN